MNYVEDDEQIRDVKDMTDEVLAELDKPQQEPVLPLKPHEHYTIADRLLRQSRALLAQADNAGRRVMQQIKGDPLGAQIEHATGRGLAHYGAQRLKRAEILAALASAHAQAAAAGALLQQHYGARFSEVFAPGNGMTKQQRDAELDAFPGTASEVNE